MYHMCAQIDQVPLCVIPGPLILPNAIDQTFLVHPFLYLFVYCAISPFHNYLHTPHKNVVKPLLRKWLCHYFSPHPRLPLFPRHPVRHPSYLCADGRGRCPNPSFRKQTCRIF